MKIQSKSTSYVLIFTILIFILLLTAVIPKTNAVSTLLNASLNTKSAVYPAGVIQTVTFQFKPEDQSTRISAVQLNIRSTGKVNLIAVEQPVSAVDGNSTLFSPLVNTVTPHKSTSMFVS